MTRYTPDQLRERAGYLESPFCAPTHGESLRMAEMLRQAADDCEDAERYRWLTSWKRPCRVEIDPDGHGFYLFTKPMLNRVIDAARTKEPT